MGYPYGIRGLFIHLRARIFSVADAFESVKVPHAPTQPTGNRVAWKILTIAAGTQFDPAIVSILRSDVKDGTANDWHLELS